MNELEIENKKKDPVLGVMSKIKNGVTIWPSNPFSGYLPKNLNYSYLQRYMHPFVHCSNIYGGQDMETTKVSFDRGLDKEDVVHMYDAILFSRKKRWITAICNNMDGYWEYHSEQSQSVRKSTEPHDFTHMWDIKLKLIDTDNSMVVTKGKGMRSGKG